MKKTVCALLCAALAVTLACPAFAAEQPAEVNEAGAYLRERGVYRGDSTGSLMLGKGLTRAELAAVITRLHGEGEVNPEHYTWACYFADVPAWAKPYVGYCIANLLVSGYDSSRYGPNDPVNPAMACTVVLRCCGYADGEGSAWSYSTACDYAVSLGLISPSTVQSPTITRGEMAVLIRRALQKQEAGQQTPPPVAVEAQAGAYQTHPDGSITISADSWSREDFSQQANPAVFTGYYTRELYNAIRQTLVDYGSQDSPDYRYAYTMVAKGDAYSAARNVLGRMDGVTILEHYAPKNLSNYWQYLDYYAVSAQMLEKYQAPLDFIQPVIEEANQLASDREKVEYLHDYLCTLLAYEEGTTAMPIRTFSQHSKELKGNCGSYALDFQFLCSAVGIPCFTISTDIHTWNMVHVDGKWLHVDVSLNDLTRSHAILLSEDYPRQIDQAPEATAFIKELMVPGSTK
ncbi:transglutaminase domain-containing protein [uncultured Oscillibacter sp.]|uniref:transglutaminase domain-containing protein n=1 Tax=uncultured Oscillibacter sp. TaxID=876091 RepID=UPI0025D2A568|nr:transglutaminase domain-containing protein [uncultured Oscillibacter sp.]